MWQNFLKSKGMIDTKFKMGLASHTGRQRVDDRRHDVLVLV